MGVGVVVSVAAENGEDIRLLGPAEITFYLRSIEGRHVYLANATTGVGQISEACNLKDVYGQSRAMYVYVRAICNKVICGRFHDYPML